MTCSSYSQFAPWRKKSQKSTSGTLCSILTIIALQRLKMRFDICGEESKELVLWLFLEETISFNGLILVQHGFDALNNAYTESPHITCCLSKMWERHFALISMKSAQEQKESSGFNRRSDEDAVLESNFNDIFVEEYETFSTKENQFRLLWVYVENTNFSATLIPLPLVALVIKRISVWHCLALWFDVFLW